MHIKQKSAAKRKRLFYTGLVIAGVLLYVMKPFKECLNNNCYYIYIII